MYLVTNIIAALSFLTPLTLADTYLPSTITASPSYPAEPSCLTLTSTEGPSCTAISSCIRLLCLRIVTVTQSCGCDTIPTVTSCETVCPTGCATTYSVVHPPCPTSPSPSPSYSASTTETEPPPTYTPPPKLISSKYYGNSTITKTSTTITTLTSCPSKVTCQGQTSTWTGTEGPFPCPTAGPSTTCSCVLPGTSVVTVTGVTSVTLSASESATETLPAEGGGGGGSATTSAVLATGAAARGAGGSGGVGGWVVGLMGLLVGLL
ncbi:hypothetical protein ONS95_007570 [Cadophora gregata]|uniref:uncharacterized protein n=1 Tax=Cadophora gregata TaxID=51156 RepID=UPI0026DDA612|nr:uncharacterized protein ONS95_007570 [Cadophora gregata]KAK0118687.1 hypothetical protein ONS96_011774 [Cadophora gregata f. sp. sojae]KAK0125948.1 hypothetical protein ONS95_007570 [Cadophora gregata]